MRAHYTTCATLLATLILPLLVHELCLGHLSWAQDRED